MAKANGEEITEEDEDEWYIRRIDAGLSVLQSVDYILAWIVMEDDGVSLPSLFDLILLPRPTFHSLCSSCLFPIRHAHLGSLCSRGASRDRKGKLTGKGDATRQDNAAEKRPILADHYR